MSGFLFGGAGGYRTPVQTRNDIAFYMLILFYFSKPGRKQAPKPNSQLFKVSLVYKSNKLTILKFIMPHNLEESEGPIKETKAYVIV